MPAIESDKENEIATLWHQGDLYLPGTGPRKPRYESFHQIDLSYLQGLLNRKLISNELAAKLLDYWDLRLSDERDPLYTQYFEYYLFFESVNSGILSAFAFDVAQSKVMHQYGVLSAAVPEMLRQLKRTSDEQENFQEFEYQGEKFTFWHKEIEYKNRRYILGVLYPLEVNIADRLQRFENVFLRYYLPDSLYPDDRFVRLYPETKARILENVQPTLEKEKPVTFTYFKFESFRKYISLAGEQFAHEIVHGLFYELTTRLKSEDECFVLNPREYCVVSVNCEKSLMQERFRKMIFQVKSLILAHEVKFTTLREPIEDLEHTWREIAIEDK